MTGTIQRRLSGLIRPTLAWRGVALRCLRAGHVWRQCAPGGCSIVETARSVRGYGRKHLQFDRDRAYSRHRSASERSAKTGNEASQTGDATASPQVAASQES